MLPKFKALKLIYLIIFQIVKRKWREIVLTTALVIAVSFVLIKLNPARSNTLTEGVIGTYQTHDLPESVTRLLSKSLVEFDENGRVRPNLVEGWEVNEEANQFKFKLKKNLTWVDHTPIKSVDLEFTIADVEVSYPDDQTIVFKLKDSFSPFPTLLTKPIFKKGTLLGVGPYQVTKTETSRIFITKLSVKTTDKELPALVIRFYPNEKTAAVAFWLGEIQALLGISDTEQFKSHPQTKFSQTITHSRMVTILYNTKDAVLSNRSLRQALSYSAPRIEGEEITKSPIPSKSWAYKEDVKQFLGNPEGAKAALERAKGTVSKESLQKEIVLTSTANLENVGKQVVSSWQGSGLKALLRVESGIPQNFQALLITQTIPTDPDQYSLWHSTQTKTNLSKYSSPRVDMDLEEGRKLLQEEGRKEKYDDFQKVLMEDAPATFLYYPKYNIIYLKKAEKNLLKVLPLQIP